MKKLFLSLAILATLLVGGDSSRAQLNQPGCVYYGGYPWRDGGCLKAQDLNQAIAQASIPPPNSSITNLQLQFPYITLDGHQVSLGSSYTLTSADVNPGINVAASTVLNSGVYGSVFVNNTTGTPVTIWLPPAPHLIGQWLAIEDIGGNAGTNAITIQDPGGILIDGAANYTLTRNFQSAVIEWTGTAWKVKASYLASVGCSQLPAFTGDVTKPSGSCALTIAAAVTSFNGRTGAILPQAADYALFTQGYWNCSFVATVATNNLTLALKDANGADPTAASPCVVTFRNAAPGTGGTVTRSVTAAQSLVLNSGSTLGTSNTIPFRVWVELFDTGTSAVLGASVQSTANAAGNAQQVFPLLESDLPSTTACAACATATAAGTFYTTAAQTTRPLRILGYAEWGSGLTTAGVWASGPTKIQGFGPGIKRPGEVIQVLSNDSFAVQTISTTTYSNTNASLNITPKSSANLIQFKYVTTINCQTCTSNYAIEQMFRGSTAVGAAQGILNSAAATIVTPIVLEGYDLPGVTTAVNYLVKAKVTTGTVVLNSHDSNSLEQLTLQEIQG